MAADIYILGHARPLTRSGRPALPPPPRISPENPEISPDSPTELQVYSGRIFSGYRPACPGSLEMIVVMARNRPFGITVLAFLAILAAIQAVVYTLQMLHLLPVTLGPVRFFTFDLLGAILWGMLALIYLWVFRMLWNLDPQGWVFVVLLSILNLIMAVLSVFGASTWEAMAPALLINGVILIYCLVPGTKEAFGVPG